MRLPPLPATFALLSAALLAQRGLPLLRRGADLGAHLPGATSRGHHTFEAACDACHTPFRGVTNEACLRCHGPGLEASEDSHPESKFADPRNAERVAGLDARACVTCHLEHAPARTREGGVTLPADFCATCHEDIGRERPSHASFGWEGCASAGCHRFHDNRGTYEGFLARHLHEPDNRADGGAPRLSPGRHAKVGDRPLGLADADGPERARPPAVTAEWASTAHARGGVNCSHCHVVPGPGRAQAAWVDRPGSASCGGCHAAERAGFERGVHGVRLAVGLGPLTAADARLPMAPEAHARALDCHACHGAHAYDPRRAAVEACLACHADRHSRAYAATRHAAAFRREVAGQAPPGSGVSCATCHLPRRGTRTPRGDEVRSDHDVSGALRPREKMVRAVCMSCHGLGFALDALADAELVARCFNGRPTVHVESLTMVEQRGGKGR